MSPIASKQSKQLSNTEGTSVVVYCNFNKHAPLQLMTAQNWLVKIMIFNILS
jgi:hypothetical protein